MREYRPSLEQGLIFGTELYPLEVQSQSVQMRYSPSAVLENIRRSSQRDEFNNFARNVFLSAISPSKTNPEPGFTLVQTAGLSLGGKTLVALAMIQEVLELPEFQHYYKDGGKLFVSYRHLFEDVDIGVSRLADRINLEAKKIGFLTDGDYGKIAANVTVPIRDAAINYLAGPRIHFEDYIPTGLPPTDCDDDIKGPDRAGTKDLYRKIRQGMEVFSLGSDLPDTVRELELSKREVVTILPTDQIIDFQTRNKKSDTREDPADIQRSARNSGNRVLLRSQQEAMYAHLYNLMKSGEVGILIPSIYCGMPSVTIQDFLESGMTEKEFVDHLKRNSVHREYFTKAYIKAWQRRLLGERFSDRSILITQPEITDGIGEDRAFLARHDVMPQLRVVFNQLKDQRLGDLLGSFGEI